MRHSETAYLVPPDDPRSLAVGICQVIEHPDLAHQMVAAAYAAVKKYTWETRAQRIGAFFKANHRELEP